MSTVLYAVLKDNHGLDAKLISGNLSFKGEYIFKQDFSITQAKSDTFATWAGHAWVTIEDYICDLSFFRSLYSDQFCKPCKNELIQLFGMGRGLLMAQANKLLSHGLFYEPVEILGDKTATGIIRGINKLL